MHDELARGKRFFGKPALAGDGLHSELLNEQLGAVTHVEANGGYVIRGVGCALAALTGKRPAVCLAIESLLEKLIGAPVRECCDRTGRSLTAPLGISELDTRTSDFQVRPDGQSPDSRRSDTARWMAVYRARETERPDAVFRDPFARALAGDRGERIAAAVPFADENAWSFVARTYLFDRIVTRQVHAGLRSRAEPRRRPRHAAVPHGSAASLRWVEVDLPDILDYKERSSATPRRVARSNASVSISPTPTRAADCSTASAAAPSRCSSSPKGCSST